VSQRSTAKRVGITGINKQPVDGPMAVRAPEPKTTTGLHAVWSATRPFDIEHHGGDEQPVYAYAREGLRLMAGQLGRVLSGGIFGENLTTVEVDVNGAVDQERLVCR
jgi:MOSC domain-containing protein YiiM